MLHIHSSFGINCRKYLILKSWDYTFSILEAMLLKHKGNKEIKLTWFENEVTEGCLSH